MNIDELKKYLLEKEYFTEGVDFQAVDQSMLRTGGSLGSKSLPFDMALAAKESIKAAKNQGRVLPYPVTEATAEQFADVMSKSKNLQSVFLNAAKNPSLTEGQKIEFRRVANRFNAIFTHYMNIAIELDRLGVKF